jgi:putative glutamine amidotransferase
MPLPMIGITTYHGINQERHPIVAVMRAYVDAILQAGGIPVMIPSNITVKALEELHSHLDGILFTGGGDVDISRFGGQAHPRVANVDLERDSIEFALLTTAISAQIPFLGICRGIQMINVGLGGTLYTHLGDQMPGAMKHDFYPKMPRNHLAHNVLIDRATKLGNILNEKELQVNSLHHQGLNSLSRQLTPVAHAPDGLVEAVELPNHRYGVAVQWHPEWLTDQEATRRLFRSFIEAACNNNDQ